MNGSVGALEAVVDACAGQKVDMRIAASKVGVNRLSAFIYSGDVRMDGDRASTIAGCTVSISDSLMSAALIRRTDHISHGYRTCASWMLFEDDEGL